MNAGGERGEMSLASMVVGMAIMLIVLAMTLGVMNGATSVAADSNRRTDAQDKARFAIDRISVALRNLASPTPEQPQAVDDAGASSLTFKTVDATGPNAGANATNIKRMRYCVNQLGQMQEQTQTWTTATVPAVPSVLGCPATGWTSSRIIAENIVNGSVPIFSYDATTLSDIAGIHLELLVDTDPTKNPPATRVASGAFLRNQNRRPTAAFVATKTTGRVVLNGSASVDPEGQQLTYSWFDGTTAIGNGITFSHTVAAGSAHAYKVVVADPAGLTATSVTQQVTG